MTFDLDFTIIKPIGCLIDFAHSRPMIQDKRDVLVSLVQEVEDIVPVSHHIVRLWRRTAKIRELFKVRIKVSSSEVPV